MNAREELYEELCMLVQDNEVRQRIYIAMDKYEIEKRTTEIALVQQDRNEYCIRKFIVGKTVKGCTERTIKQYKAEITRALERIGKTVDEITSDDVKMYIAVRTVRDKVSKTTVGNEIRYMKSFFEYLYTEEEIKRNPMLRVERIKEEKVKKEAFTEVEIERMRYLIQNTMEKAIFEVLLSTGCRVSELVSIKWEDIHESEVKIMGKGRKERIVYLNAKAQVALQKYRDDRKDQNPYVFCEGNSVKEMKRGTKEEKLQEWYKDPEQVKDGSLGTGTVEKKIRELGKKADCRAHPHKFRRTCATYALRRGMPIEQVSKMLGHESIETTQIYLDLSEEDLKQAHKKYVI